MQIAFSIAALALSVSSCSFVPEMERKRNYRPYTGPLKLVDRPFVIGDYECDPIVIYGAYHDWDNNPAEEGQSFNCFVSPAGVNTISVSDFGLGRNAEDVLFSNLGTESNIIVFDLEKQEISHHFEKDRSLQISIITKKIDFVGPEGCDKKKKEVFSVLFSKYFPNNKNTYDSCETKSDCIEGYVPQLFGRETSCPSLYNKDSLQAYDAYLSSPEYKSLSSKFDRISCRKSSRFFHFVCPRYDEKSVGCIDGKCVRIK